jgi:hypothetical protein
VLCFLGLAWLLYTQRVRLAWLREVLRREQRQEVAAGLQNEPDA